MLEILLVWTLAKRIGNIVQNKGHSRFGYQLLLVVLWIGGEVAGGFIGAITQEGGGQGEKGFPCMAYVCALVGAAIGAGIAFAIANGLTNVRPDAEFYQEADYDRRHDDEIRRTWRAPEDRPPGTDAHQERPADDRIQE